MAWDPSRALGLWDETRSFEELRSHIQALDRTKAIFWAARLNLLRMCCMMHDTSSFDDLASIFFTGAEIRTMVKALKRAHKPRKNLLAMLGRRSLLEIIRWSALLGENHSIEDANLSFDEARHLFAAARCTFVQPLQRSTMEHAEPYLEAFGSGPAPPEFSLPLFRDLWALNYVPDQRQRIVGRSAVLLCQEFFGRAHDLRLLFEEVAGLTVEEYLGSVLRIAGQISSSVNLRSGAGITAFGQLPNGQDSQAPDALARFLELESQTLDDLRSALLRRLDTSHIDAKTPFDTTALRSRPFLRSAHHGGLILSDLNFLEDKLWIGPVFHLLAKSEPKAIFGAFGGAVERYAARLIQSVFARADKGTYDGLVLNPHGMVGPDRKELTDVCLRCGTTLLMIETKAVTLPEHLMWFHGDASYMRAIEKRLAGSGSGAKGVGQLARSIFELAHGKVRPDNEEMFSNVERIMPILLAHDSDISAPMHSPFIARQFVDALEAREGTQLEKANGRLRLGETEIYLPTLMTISDLEVIEGYYCKLGIAGLIDSYYEKDPDRQLSLTTLFELVAHVRPRKQLDTSSLLAKEAKKLVSSLE